MRERSYVFVSPFEIPSIVENARKTKVNLGGKRKGRSACVAKRSCPSLARRAGYREGFEIWWAGPGQRK